jgi:hypothetical protein
LGDREGEGVAASGDEDDFDALGVGTAESGQVGVRNFELGIEQCAVDIDGNQAERMGRHMQF